uniref:Uncharacterized protein n=1 Tax=Meloidogyne javanica TaxID=6303 RepID=A0A915LSE6_MELJA
MSVSYREVRGDHIKRVLIKKFGRGSYNDDSAQQKDHLTDKERELQLFDPSYSNSAPGPPNDATFETIKDATLVTKEINEHDPSFYNCIYGIPDSVQQVLGVAIVQSQYEPPTSQSSKEQSFFVGILSVITMCISSAFAEGLFVGFDVLVWVMTATNSLGGLLIAVVIKYADNILKAYAQAAAIVGAAFGSWLLFDFSPNNLFLFGTLMVAVSVYLYNGYPQERRNMEEENNKLNSFSFLNNRLDNEVEDDFSEKNVHLIP